MLTSLALIFLSGLAMNALCRRLRLPGIIGMLAAGMLLGPYALNLLDGQILDISPSLRQMALVVILLRAGLTLNPMVGAAAMSLSSFCVVTNALRLNFFKPDRPFKGKSKPPVKLPELMPAEENIKNTEETAMKKTVYIEGMMCNHCTAHVQKALEALDGVESVEVSLEDKKAVLTLKNDVDNAVIMNAVKNAGYEPTKCE